MFLGGKRELCDINSNGNFADRINLLFQGLVFFFFSVAAVVKEAETAIRSGFTIPFGVINNLMVTPDFFLLFLCHIILLI